MLYRLTKKIVNACVHRVNNKFWVNILGLERCMFMLRKIGIILILVLCVSLMACNKVEEDKAEAEKKKEATNPPVANDFKVGMIVGKEEAKESDFVKSAINGLNNFNFKTSCEVVISEVDALENTKDAVKLLVDDKCDLIWVVGSLYGDEIVKVAKDYPDTNFAVVDGQYDKSLKNVTGVGFRSNEAAFLAGYIAAYKSESKKIGFIGGLETSVIEGFEVGYRAGARYYDETVEVAVAYAQSFTDKEIVRGIAKGMYDNGYDVVFPAAGAAGLGAIEEANAQKKFVIGVDADQSNLGEDVVITSVLKMVDSAVEYVCLRAKEGIDVGGQNINYGLSDGAVGIPKYDEKFIPLLEQNKLDNLKEMIVSDRLIVPDTREELESFDPVRE